MANTYSDQQSLVIGRCLVTGAGGFIGLQLCSQLQKHNIPVRMLLRKPISSGKSTDTVIGELGSDNISYESLLCEIDTVFHLANTAHISAASDCYKIDCEVTLALARNAQQAGVRRFVFISSTKAAADPGLYKCDESWDEWPNDGYGYWKRKTEERLLNEINIPHVAIVRPSLVYGAGVKGNLQKLICAIDKGYCPPLPDIDAERSMVSVHDVVSAILIAAVHIDANRQPLIVADGEAYTPFSIYLAIRAVLGKGKPGWSLPLPLLTSAGFLGDFLQRIWKTCPISSEVVSRLTEPCAYSSNKLRQLGWRPSTTFYKELPAIIAACQDVKL